VLGKNFENEQSGREIIADIEARISELLAEREGGVTRVVTIEDVTKMIETLGTPEDITGSDADEMPNDEKPPRPQQPRKPLKRLYRDLDRRFIGGVCAGLGAWIGIKPIIVRLIFIFLIILPFRGCIGSIMIGHGNGILVLVYIILWIIIPKAKTTAQKLEMRGEPVNISNIEKNIKESFSDPSLKNSFRNFLNEFGDFLSKFFRLFGRIIGVIIGLVLILLGLGFATGMISILSMQELIINSNDQHFNVEWDFLSYSEMFKNIISPMSYIIMIICAFLVISLLVFALIFWGVKLIAGFKVKHGWFHVLMMLLWIAAIATGIVTCATQVRYFAWNNDAAVETIYIAQSDTLYLTRATMNKQISNNPMDIYFDRGNRCFYGTPSLYVHKSENGETKLRLYRQSRGESKLAAYQYAENIEYTIEVRDSLLIFDPFFTVKPQDKWKFQTLTVNLYVPTGTIIIDEKAICNDRILGRMFQWHSNEECIWVMTENNGLQRISD